MLPEEIEVWAILSAASLSRSSCTLVERPSAFHCRMRSVSLLVPFGGSETSVLGCAEMFGLIGGTTADPTSAVEGCGSCVSSEL